MVFIWGGNMYQVIEAINTSSANQQEIQIFIGYFGWDVGELEAEVEEGSWIFSYYPKPKSTDFSRFQGYFPHAEGDYETIYLFNN